ncbi:hypothetical protein FQZ97_993120 [compost metagenome]
MSKAALWATSTVSSAKRWNNGSTSPMLGCPASICGVRPCTCCDSRGMGRCGSISCSKHSCISSRPLTTRTAPIEMISSPSEGDSPVVSVSNTV